MNEMDGLTKRFINNKNQLKDIVHSIPYANAQNGNIGADSTQSFEERKKIEADRKMVRKYSDSRIARNPFNKRPKALVANREDSRDIRHNIDDPRKAAFRDSKLRIEDSGDSRRLNIRKNKLRIDGPVKDRRSVTFKPKFTGIRLGKRP